MAGKVGWVDVREIAAVNVEVLLNPEKFRNQTLGITGSKALSHAGAVAMLNDVLDAICAHKQIAKQSAILIKPNLTTAKNMMGFAQPKY